MKTLKYASSCYVILICTFVLTLDRKLTFYKDFLQTKKQFIKVLQYYVRDVLSFSNKKKERNEKMYKEMCGTVKKIKSVKNVIKKVS